MRLELDMQFDDLPSDSNKHHFQQLWRSCILVASELYLLHQTFLFIYVYFNFNPRGRPRHSDN